MESVGRIAVRTPGGPGAHARTIDPRGSIGGLGPVLVGGPATVADALERWVDEGGIDGFNLAYAVTPGSVTDFIDHVVPELRRRGRVQERYRPGVFRQKLNGGADAFAVAPHPAASFRGSLAGGRSVADGTARSNFASG